MAVGTRLKMRGAKVTSIQVGPTWTAITIRIRTDSVTAQGAAKILKGEEGKFARRRMRRRAREA